ERHHVVDECRAQEAAGSRRETLDGLLAAQAARTPDAVAVDGGAAGEERWSYGHLDRAAARVALRLRALGAGPESRVAVCAARTPRLLAALLGVLKSGAAYVPLDPD